MKKICFIASSGGHYEQIMQLKTIMKHNNSFIITEKTEIQNPNQEFTTYFLQQVNRKEWGCFAKMFKNTIDSFIIYLKEKPDIVISTGALAVIPFCIIAKIFKRKLIFIESYAKVRSGTMTGRLLYRFADIFIVQWDSMRDVYPKALYFGGIY